jgi:hypothetical protein
MRIFTSVALFSLALAPMARSAELHENTLAAWRHYIERTEARIGREVASGERFLVRDSLPAVERAAAKAALERGEVFTTKLRTLDEDGSEIEVPGGMIHHWLGSVLVPGVDVATLVHWLQSYDDHQRYFDEVEASKLVSREGESFEIFLRLRRKKVVTVYYNTDHHVEYRGHGHGLVSSISRSTRIAEVEDAGTADEKEKPIGNDRGFLWRLNSYWRFQQVPGGVVVECESVSLSRGVPLAVRWLVGSYLDSVPRESLASTLVPIRKGASSLVAEAPKKKESRPGQ